MPAAPHPNPQATLTGSLRRSEPDQCAKCSTLHRELQEVFKQKSDPVDYLFIQETQKSPPKILEKNRDGGLTLFDFQTYSP